MLWLLQDDDVWEDWLHLVMKLLLGYPIHISLPLDAYGQPDFMDAWWVAPGRCDMHVLCCAMPVLLLFF